MSLQGLRRRGRRPWAMLVLSVAAVAVTAGWAYRRLPSPTVVAPETALEEVTHATPQAPERIALDTRAFDTPLWVAPPAPPAPPPPVPPPPPPPPLRLQLIAVLTEPSGSPQGALQSGLFYDPDADKLVILKVGDRLAGRAIERIDGQGVTIREQTGSRRLALRDDVAAVPPVLMTPRTATANPPASGGSP